MDTRYSDFSIDRILGHKVEHSSPTAVEPLNYIGYLPDSHLQRQPSDFPGCWDYPRPISRPPLTFPMGLLPVRHRVDLNYGYFGDTPYNHQSSNLNYNPNQVAYGFNEETGPPPFPCILGQLSVGTQSRQRGRVRTVFTACQTAHLEHLFEETDYPSVDARAELSRNTGLTEEIVRVWFKNRRSRHKQYRGGPKVKSESAGLTRETEAHRPILNNEHLVMQENVLSSFL